jgi:putative membrane protein
METQKSKNADLILREELALDRTKMAQYRTFLAFLRTALYFPVAGISMNQGLDISYGKYLQWGGISLGIVIMIAGLFFYYYTRERIKKFSASIWKDIDSEI